MTATIIANAPPYSYGQMTNQAISKLIALQTLIERVNDAIATASSGYTGTPGTEFEAKVDVVMTPLSPAPPNLFGITPAGAPGEQGSAYKYAMTRLHEEWAAFWLVAEPFIEQLDNGTPSYP
jgi:hypothetical protein